MTLTLKKPAVSTLGPLGAPPRSLANMPGCQCHHANTLGEDAEAVEAKAEEPVIAKSLAEVQHPDALGAPDPPQHIYWRMPKTFLH